MILNKKWHGIFLVLDTHSGKQNQDAAKEVNGNKTVNFIDSATSFFEKMKQDKIKLEHI